MHVQALTHPAATLLRVICRTSKVRKWRAQKSYKAEKVRYQVEYALRSEPNDSVLEAEFERPHMDRIFGKTVVLAKLAEWRERQKVDQEAVQRGKLCSIVMSLDRGVLDLGTWHAYSRGTAVYRREVQNVDSCLLSLDDSPTDRFH